jgi:hypothetical protein
MYRTEFKCFDRKRDWYHLDRRLLNDPEILSTRVINNASTAAPVTVPPPSATVAAAAEEPLAHTASNAEEQTQKQEDIPQVIEI